MASSRTGCELLLYGLEIIVGYDAQRFILIRHVLVDIFHVRNAETGILVELHASSIKANLAAKHRIKENGPNGGEAPIGTLPRRDSLGLKLAG